jgi:phage-related protein
LADFLPPIVVEIVARTDKLRDGLQKAETDVKSAASNIDRSADKAGKSTEKIGDGMHKSSKKTEDAANRINTGLDKLAGHLNNLGGPFSTLGGHLERADYRLQGISQESGAVSDAMNAVGPAGLALGAAFVGVAGYAAKLQMGMESASASIAANAGISQDAAKNIGESFVNTAGETTSTSTELAAVFGTVAGQMKALEGRALGVAQADRLMRAADNLATASKTDLGTATKSLTDVMQSYKIKTEGAAKATDILYEASNKTHIPLQMLAKMLQMNKSRLGEYAGSLGETATFTTELSKAGIAGRMATTMLGSAMTSVAKQATALRESQKGVKESLDAMPPRLQAFSRGLLDGKVSMSQYKEEIKKVSPAEKEMAANFLSTVKSASKAELAFKGIALKVFDTHGKFIGLKNIVMQLHGQFEKLDPASRKAAASMLFGRSAADAMTKIILQGGPAYNKLHAEITKNKAAQEASNKVNDTVAGKWKMITAAFKDFLTKGGGPVAAILKVLLNGVLWFVKGLKDGNPIVMGITGAIAALAIALAVAAVAASPLTWAMAGIGLAIAAAGAAVMLLITHFSDIINWLKNNWKTIISIVLGPLGLLIVYIVDHFSQIKKTVMTIVNAVISFLKGAWEGIKNTVSTVWGAIASVFTSVWNVISGVWKGAIHGLEEIFQGFGEAVSSVWNFVKGTLESGINGAISLVNKAIEGINSLGGVVGIHIGLIPEVHLAEGGLVTKPTLALIGEAGPELVVPLSKMGTHGVSAAAMRSAGVPALENGEPVERAKTAAAIYTGGSGGATHPLSEHHRKHHRKHHRRHHHRHHKSYLEEPLGTEMEGLIKRERPAPHPRKPVVHYRPPHLPTVTHLFPSSSGSSGGSGGSSHHASQHAAASTASHHKKTVDHLNQEMKRAFQEMRGKLSFHEYGLDAIMKSAAAYEHTHRKTFNRTRFLGIERMLGDYAKRAERHEVDYSRGLRTHVEGLQEGEVRRANYLTYLLEKKPFAIYKPQEVTSGAYKGFMEPHVVYENKKGGRKLRMGFEQPGGDYKAHRATEFKIEHLTVHGADNYEVAREMYRQIRPHLKAAM